MAGKYAFGGENTAPLSAEDRRAAAARLMPRLRGLMAGTRAKAAHFSDDPETLEFVGSRDFDRLAAIGTTCPDHFLRTKITPMTIDPARLEEESYYYAASTEHRRG